jgi:hypothetical protein
MSSYVLGVDAERIAELSPQLIASFVVLNAYAPAFGSTQGPALETPFGWIKAQTKPIWLIAFPGADPALLIAYFRQCEPQAVGVLVDLEPQFEGDARSLGQCQVIGDALLRVTIPSAIYSHEKTCQALSAHFDGQVWDGFSAVPPALPARVGVQYGQKWEGGIPYDLDAYDPWFARPFVSAPPPAAQPPSRRADMEQWITESGAYVADWTGYSFAVPSDTPGGPQDLSKIQGLPVLHVDAAIFTATMAARKAALSGPTAAPAAPTPAAP